jgi:hypothetical protein
MQNDDLVAGQAIYLFHKTIGYVAGFSAEDKRKREGLAYLRVHVNSANLPAISEMVVNTNSWDVWDAENIEVLKSLARNAVRPDVVR